MSGNSRFDLSAASPEELAFKGTILNGQRGNLMSGSLERSGSFREGNEGRMFNSGASMFRGNSTSARDLPPLSQCLMLDPINMGEQKLIRSGELKKALGISGGSTLEDCSFGASNLKASSPVATEDLKRFKASVVEASVKASIHLNAKVGGSTTPCWAKPQLFCCRFLMANLALVPMASAWGAIWKNLISNPHFLVYPLSPGFQPLCSR